MKKKFFLGVAILAVIVALGFGYLILGQGTAFSDKVKYVEIDNGKTNRDSVLSLLKRKYIVRFPGLFGFVADRLHMWQHLKAGRYEIEKGESILHMVRMFRNNKQAEVNLVINHLRIKEDLAHLIAKDFDTDSSNVMDFLNSNDSLRPYGVDTNTVFTSIISDTYRFKWKTPLSKIFSRLKTARDKFWNKKDRLEKAKKLGFTPQQIYIIASIVEEETNKDDDKGKIASVYINRLHKNMLLQACPTIKFAMKAFDIERIYDKYLLSPSPYNTYRKKGLPPGPICIPSQKTIDLVLNSPKTNYLYFVAKSDFSGWAIFSSDYQQHAYYAREYQKALDQYLLKKGK